MKKYGDEEVDEMVEKWWKQRLGYIPEYIDTWATLSPESFKGWVKIRSSVYAGGALPRKVKMLIVLGIQAAIRRPFNMHIQRAKDAGATKEEIFEAVMLSFMFGSGVVAPQMATGLWEDKD
jgi:alkylhydroperoxidase/carboxymuconolactone decarboxylase family protein YurZ